MLKTRLALMNDSLGSGDRMAPSSKTSPLLINLAARKTVSGFIKLPEPRWSPAPHLDGQRSLSGGMRQVCAPTGAAPSASAAAAAKVKEMMRISPPPDVAYYFVPSSNLTPSDLPKYS